MGKQDEEYMISTFDNPFDPFKQFEAWWKYDMMMGHDTCGTLARMANTSPLFSDEVNEAYIDAAIERMIQLEPMLYRKVYESDFRKVATV